MSALKAKEKLLEKERERKMEIADKLHLKKTTLGDKLNIEDFFLLSESIDIEADDRERINEYHEGHMRSIRSSVRKTYPNNDAVQLAALIERENVLHPEFVKADGSKKKADKEFSRARITSDGVVVLDDREMEASPVLQEEDVILELREFLDFPESSCYISLLENDISCNKNWWRGLLDNAGLIVSTLMHGLNTGY